MRPIVTCANKYSHLYVSCIVDLESSYQRAPAYDFTSGQILICPAYSQKKKDAHYYTSLRKNGILVYTTEHYLTSNLTPNGYSAKNVDLVVEDIPVDSLMITLKSIRNGAISMANTVNQHRITNAITRKTNKKLFQLATHACKKITWGIHSFEPFLYTTIFFETQDDYCLKRDTVFLDAILRNLAALQRFDSNSTAVNPSDITPRQSILDMYGDTSKSSTPHLKSALKKRAPTFDSVQFATILEQLHQSKNPHSIRYFKNILIDFINQPILNYFNTIKTQVENGKRVVKYPDFMKLDQFPRLCHIDQYRSETEAESPIGVTAGEPILHLRDTKVLFGHSGGVKRDTNSKVSFNFLIERRIIKYDGPKHIFAHDDDSIYDDWYGPDFRPPTIIYNLPMLISSNLQQPLFRGANNFPFYGDVDELTLPMDIKTKKPFLSQFGEDQLKFNRTRLALCKPSTCVKNLDAKSVPITPTLLKLDKTRYFLPNRKDVPNKILKPIVTSTAQQNHETRARTSFIEAPTLPPTEFETWYGDQAITHGFAYMESDVHEISTFESGLWYYVGTPHYLSEQSTVAGKAVSRSWNDVKETYNKVRATIDNIKIVSETVADTLRFLNPFW